MKLLWLFFTLLTSSKHKYTVHTHRKKHIITSSTRGRVFGRSTPVKNRTHQPYTVTNSHGTYKVYPCTKLCFTETGIASYYGKAFHGKPTASGMKFNMNAYTAAHRTAHLPSVAIVTYEDKSRLVLLNDRGPFAKGRILDCSHKLARDLGFEKHGHAQVRIKILDRETRALVQNGGKISWNGIGRFPMKTTANKHCIHHHPVGHV